jgi:hypothetical protein
LANGRVPYSNETAPPGTIATVRVGDVTLAAFDGTTLDSGEFKTRSTEFNKQLKKLLSDAGYPNSADPNQVNYVMVFVLLFVISLYGPFVYASQASWLVELFPARIRYTSMSLPYHVGNGWFAGFLPTVAFALIAYTGNIYQGLWYPVGVAFMSLVVGGLFLRETRGIAVEH